MSKSAPEHLAQALLAGLMQGLGEKYNDQQLINAGLKLGAIAIKNDASSFAVLRLLIKSLGTSLRGGDLNLPGTRVDEIWSFLKRSKCGSREVPAYPQTLRSMRQGGER